MLVILISVTYKLMKKGFLADSIDLVLFYLLIYHMYRFQLFDGFSIF